MGERDFIDWLSYEMKSRGINQSELARMAGITQGVISKVLIGINKPGIDFCNAIAKAFDISPVDVFIRAGLLPRNAISGIKHEIGQDHLDQEDQNLLQWYRSLPSDDRNKVMVMIRALVEKAEGKRTRARTK